MADTLAEMLVEAARYYAEDATATGCMVLEGTRCNDPEARDAACRFHRATQEFIRSTIAERYPQEANQVSASMPLQPSVFRNIAAVGRKKVRQLNVDGQTR